MINIELKKRLEECIRNQDDVGGEPILLELLTRAVQELEESVDSGNSQLQSIKNQLQDFKKSHPEITQDGL